MYVSARIFLFMDIYYMYVSACIILLIVSGYRSYTHICFAIHRCAGGGACVYDTIETQTFGGAELDRRSK